MFSLFLANAGAQTSRKQWVDSVFSTLDEGRKIGQLFMIPISSYATEEQIDALLDEIKDYEPGGLYIKGGGPITLARLVNKLQKKSKVPMMTAISAEWGPGQTLDSITDLHKPLVSTALKNDSLFSVWVSEIARQMDLLNLHINMSPNADHEMSEGYLRYFSNDEKIVARQAILFSRVLQSEGILSVARHVSRNTKAGNVRDTTLVLKLDQIDTAAYLSFHQLIDSGVDGIMTKNLHFSMTGENGIVPASISPVFTTEILRKKLKFGGLIFTDLSDFKNINPKMKSGDAEFVAFSSGNDVLMMPENINDGIKRIAKAIKKDKVLQQQLDTSVKKILEAKFNAGLSHYRPISTDNLLRKLNSPQSKLLTHQLAEASITVVKNTNGYLPVMTLEDNSFTCISIGKQKDNEFTRYLNKYVPFETIQILDAKDTAGLQLKDKTIIIAVYQYAANLEKALTSWVNKIASRENVILVHFGNPSTLSNYQNTSATIAAYTEQNDMCQIVPQIIFGALPSKGSLPLDVGPLKSGISFRTVKTDRLSYTLPEAAGLDSRTLEKIEKIMNEAIADGATPGCHVLVAKDGKVVYEKSAGFLSYDKKTPVTEETIYDLASVTKVSATLQTTMFLYEHEMIDLNKKASYYLPELRESNKKDIILKDILTHQAGLWPTVFFWTSTLKDGKQLPEYYSTVQSSEYPFPVSGNIFAVKSMKDSLWKWTIQSKVREKPNRTPYDFRYSDVGSYILQHLAERLLNQPMDEFLGQNLYEPLGAGTLGYLPLTKFPISRVAPTENDTIFRKNLLTGYVHDQGAAMHGGIAGHAGLFGDANDLAKLGQMWLQEGHYGGIRYFKPSTVNLFTAKQYDGSRRALGWDKPPVGEYVTPTSLFASSKTFGHTGFTGTCIWVDPEFNLVYIFLSNRVNPDMNNNKLGNSNIRPRIQDIVYQSMFDYCSY